VDTSDDSQPIEQDTDPHLVPDDGDAGDGGDPLEADPLADAPSGNLALAVLAAVGACAVAVVLWTVLMLAGGREFVGLTVIAGLAAGYLLRRVSGRSTTVVRVLAGLVTAVACVVGTVTAVVAFTSRTYHVGYVDLLRHFHYSETFTVVKHRRGMTLVVYAAAVVIAYLSAGPQKPKKVKDEPDAEIPEPVVPAESE
jgi:hypothetical protein